MLKKKNCFLIFLFSIIYFPIYAFVNKDSLISDKSIITISEIKIIGNKRTKESIIYRELAIKAGDQISLLNSKSLLKAERNKIFNINLFTVVTVTLDSIINQKANVIINVKEQWYTIPAPIISFADRNFNEWWFQRGRSLKRVNYGMRFYQRNCRGRNETFKIIAQGGFTNQFEMSYDIPYLDKKQRLGMRFGGGYSNNKQIAFATENHKLKFANIENFIRHNYKLGVSLRYRKGFFINHTFETQFYRNFINDTVAKLNPDYFLNSNTFQQYLGAKYGFVYDKRDVRQFANKGTFIKIDFEHLGFLKSDDINLTSISGTYSKYIPISKKIFLAHRFKLKASAPNLQPWTHFNSLGYSEDFVRGYWQYAIDGQHYVLLRNSFRYKFFSTIFDLKKYMPVNQFRSIPIDIYFNVFADGGYVSRTNPQVFSNQRLSNQLLTGTGVGLYIVTFYDSVVRFEYSLNHLNERTFSLGFISDI